MAKPDEDLRRPGGVCRQARRCTAARGRQRGNASLRRVAVTGIGVISPLGNDAETFFDNLARGRTGIVALPAPTLAPAGGPVLRNPRDHIGGAVAFDGARHFPAPKLRMLDRVSQFA